MTDSKDSRGPIRLSPDRRERWLELVKAMEQSRLHERPDREEAMEILLRQYEGKGPILPVAFRENLSEQEVQRRIEEGRALFQKSPASPADSEAEPKANS